MSLPLPASMKTNSHANTAYTRHTVSSVKPNINRDIEEPFEDSTKSHRAYVAEKQSGSGFARLRLLVLIAVTLVMLTNYQIIQSRKLDFARTGNQIPSLISMVEAIVAQQGGTISFPDKTFLVHVPTQISNYQNTFNHPWHLLLLTRRCGLKKHQCSFISIDRKYKRYFTQINNEHKWIDDPYELKSVLSRVNSTLIMNSDIANYTKTSKYDVAITTRYQTEYEHSIGDSDQPSLKLERIGLQECSHKPTDRIQITHHKPSLPTDFQFNFISNIYRDVPDFVSRVQKGLADSGEKEYEAKQPLIVAFLPNCSNIAPSHLAYLNRHVKG